jgi:hypothetical protein
MNRSPPEFVWPLDYEEEDVMAAAHILSPQYLSLKSLDNLTVRCGGLELILHANNELLIAVANADSITYEELYRALKSVPLVVKLQFEDSRLHFDDTNPTGLCLPIVHHQKHLRHAALQANPSATYVPRAIDFDNPAEVKAFSDYVSSLPGDGAPKTREFLDKVKSVLFHKRRTLLAKHWIDAQLSTLEPISTVACAMFVAMDANRNILIMQESSLAPQRLGVFSYEDLCELEKARAAQIQFQSEHFFFVPNVPLQELWRDTAYVELVNEVRLFNFIICITFILY